MSERSALFGDSDIEKPDLDLSGWTTGFESDDLAEDSLAMAQVDIAYYEDVLIEEKDAGKTLTTFSLVLMIYFLTCGGPFGIEVAVGSGGPMLTLIGLALIALLWSFPQAIISAEMSLMLPDNGGSVVWVNTAFGGESIFAFFNSMNLVLNCATAYSIMIVLFVDYMMTAVTLSIGIQWLIKIVFVIVVALLNVVGTTWVARLSLPLLILVMLPFVAMLAYEGYTGALTNPASWTPFSEIPVIDWPVFISTLCWAFGGFDSIGAVAGEVKGGKKTYITALFISFPIVLLNYLLPILAAFVGSSDLALWGAGGFGEIAYGLVDWLGVMMVVGACLSNLGQYNSGIAALARMVWAMSLKGDSQVLPAVLALSHVSEKKVVRPIAAIAASTVLCLGFSALPFDVVIQIYLLQRAINLWLTYAAFIRCRYEPFAQLDRPFVAPGGKVMAWIYGAPTVVLSIVCLVFTRDALVWIVSGAIEGTLLLVFLIITLVKRRQHRLQPSAI